MTDTDNIAYLSEMADALGLNWRADLNLDGSPMFQIICEYSDDHHEEIAWEYDQHEFDVYLRGRVDERDAWRRVSDHYVGQAAFPNNQQL